MAEMRKIKTAIVGCGMISNVYARNLKYLFSVTELVAMCDMNEDAAKKRAEQYGVDRVLTLDEVCSDPEIELVVNLTGPAAHYDVIKKLLLAGKHVFTEKLLCFDFEQGKELVSIANEKKLYLGVAPDTFLGAGLQTARKIIDAGLIGTPTSCRAAINRNQALNSEGWGYIRYTRGSFPYDIGVYYVTALLSLLGPVKDVTGFAAPAPTHQGRMFYKGFCGDDWNLTGNNIQAGALMFESGVLGTVHFDGTSIDEEHPAIAIYGTEGILYLGDPNTFCGEVKLVRSGEGECIIPFTHGYKGSPQFGPEADTAGAGHRGVGAAEMCWSMIAGRNNRASKELGLHTLELINGLDVSSATGKTYEMETTFEQPKPVPSGYYTMEMSNFLRADAEMSLV